MSDQDRQEFESLIESLEAELANFGAQLAHDAQVRQAYSRQISAMSDNLRDLARSGRLTWAQAAEEANFLRNQILEIGRTRNTTWGRSIAEATKKSGRTLNEIIAKKTLDLFPNNPNFNNLTAAQRNRVFEAVVESAGKHRGGVFSPRTLSRAGRGLLFFSLALSVYTVATADDPLEAAAREGAVTGAGILGGIGGGALAGLACGPGAPVCVTIGVFVGGACAAFGVDFFW